MVQSAIIQYSRLNISVIIDSNLKILTQFFIFIVYLNSSQWNSKIYFSGKHPIVYIRVLFKVKVLDSKSTDGLKSLPYKFGK
jgi:hypothetical protein